MQLWVFDRSGPYCGTEFDIHEEPERFMQAVVGYSMMDDQELGLDTFIQSRDNQRFIQVRDQAGILQELQLEQIPIAHQRAIICRGTNCFRAKHAELRHGLRFGRPHKYRTVARSGSQSSQSHSLSHHDVSAFTASSSPRKRKANDHEASAAKRSKSNSQVSEIGNSEAEVSFEVEDKQKTSLAQSNHDTFDNRIFCCLVISPSGRPLRSFRSVKELCEVFRDAIRAHRSLYEAGRILHRDVSENNMIIVDGAKAEDPKGMLIDLDLAKELDGGARHRTGTMEFMAIEVLQGVSHTYRHDLESFFYVFLWLCVRRGAERFSRRKVSPYRVLTSWYTGDHEQIADAKRGQMDKGGFQRILDAFSSPLDALKPVAEKIRCILFPFKDRLFTGTPKDPSIFYNSIIRGILRSRRQPSKQSRF
jgi:hypothetical protein